MNKIIHDELAVEALDMQAIELFRVADAAPWKRLVGEVAGLQIHGERHSGTRWQRRLEAAADRLLLSAADVAF